MPDRLDLGQYRSEGARVFAGRGRGREVRLAAQIDRHDAQPGPHTLVVHVPEDTFAVTSSFFLGLFGDSIRKLGADEFRRRYPVTGKSIERVREDAIREASKAQTSLRQAK